MKKFPASPFAMLVAGVPARLPKGPATTIVVNGQRITHARQLRTRGDEVDELDKEHAAALKRELERDRNRRRYQRDRLDPEKVAKRKAYAEANREKTRAWKREYDLRNRDRMRVLQADWARRERHLHPEVTNARQRRYYEKNRERVLERSRQARAAKKPDGEALRVIHTSPRWTASRQAWLERVAADPFNKREKGQVGYQCHQFGWTQWQHGPKNERLFHEELTAAGRAVLAEWQAQHPSPCSHPRTP